MDEIVLVEVLGDTLHHVRSHARSIGPKFTCASHLARTASARRTEPTHARATYTLDMPELPGPSLCMLGTAMVLPSWKRKPETC